MLKIALAKLLTVKVAGIAAALTAGGIAVAAATGTLPAQHGNTPAGPNSGQVVETTLTTTVGTSTDADKNNGSNSASPSPSLEGLCQAYTAGAGADHGKALDNPAFTVLITTAGGKDKVSAYCADLLGDKPGNPSDRPTDKAPTHANPDKDHPTGGPTTRPGR